MHLPPHTHAHTVAASLVHAQACIPSSTSVCLPPHHTYRRRLAGTCAGMHSKLHISMPPTHALTVSASLVHAQACIPSGTSACLPPTHTVAASLVHAQACMSSGTSAHTPTHTHTPLPPRWYMHRHAYQAAHRHASHTRTHRHCLAGTELPGSRLRHTHMPFAAAALADRHAGKGISVALLPCCGHTHPFPSLPIGSLGALSLRAAMIG